MSVKAPPQLTWQDKFILIAIPLVVFTIFIFANQMSRDLTTAEAIQAKKTDIDVRESGKIIKLYKQVASDTISCRVKSLYGGNEFDFHYKVIGSETIQFAIDREIKMLGQFKADENGGSVTAPYITKYNGRTNGWLMYDNKTYVGSMMQEDPMNPNANPMLPNNQQTKPAPQNTGNAQPVSTQTPAPETK